MFYSLLRFQRFLESLYQGFLSLLRVAFRFRWRKGVPQLAHAGDSLFILANGPSLREDLARFSPILEKGNLLCVNQFVLDEAFVALRPSHYILLDIGFFVGKTIPRVEEVRERVLNALIEKTEWPLVLCVPAEARGSRFCREIAASGKPIRILYINRTVVDGWKPLRHWLYKRQAGMPPPQNVLIGAIMSAIWMGYRKMVILGADHTWHQGLEVGPDGVLVSAEHHFYDAKPWKVQIHHPETLSRATVHDYFHNLYRTFRSYHLIRGYADAKGIEIINASRVTFIDAFVRKPMEDYPWEAR